MKLMYLYFSMFDIVVSAENDHCQMRGAALGSLISHKEKQKLMQYPWKARQIPSTWYISTVSYGGLAQSSSGTFLHIFYAISSVWAIFGTNQKSSRYTV